MAYAAVSSLVQTLENQVKLASFAFQIKITLAQCFNKNVAADIKLLEAKSNEWECHLKHVREELESLPLANVRQINDIVCDSNILLISQTLRSTLSYISPESVSIHNGTPKFMEEEKKKIMEEIDLLEAKLKEFLDVSDVDSMRRNPGRYMFQQHFCKEVRELLSWYEEFKEGITFSYEITLEITVLCHNLRYLLTFLEDHSNGCHHHIVESIRDVAYEARDHVETHMVDNQIEHASMSFLAHLSLGEVLLPIWQRALGFWRIFGLKDFLKTEVNEFFRQEEARKSLLQTLKKVHSIRKQIEDVNCMPLNTEDLRTLKATLDSPPEGNSKQENVVMGLDDDMTSIIEKLTRSPPFHVEILIIVGMGGIGKTTLARKVYDHPSVVSHFHCHAWITVSQVYEEKNLLFCLLCSVSQPTYSSHEKSNEDIGEELYRKLKGRRYLIVMDDMWNIKAWNAVQRYLPDDGIGSRVILTSRSIISESEPKRNCHHFMRLLDRDQSWKLLEKVVFGTKCCPEELQDVGQQIASKCRGLPLAIVVIAGLLSRISRTKDCWKDIADSVKSIVCLDPKECMEILALSYNHLPNHLKECFLYLGAFPEDCEIDVGKLVQLWIAEGFLGPECAGDLEHVAEDYLEDLIGRNLVLVGKRSFCGKVKTCHLHDFFRELCLREARKGKFMHVVPKGAQGIRPSIRDLRRLSFHSDCIEDYLVPSFSHGHSFICFSLGHHFSADILLLELRLKLLRVLDVYFLHFDYFPIQILKLVHLRYLGLNVTYEFPASISQLQNLQVLSVSGPWESPTLSLEYWTMPSLRHLQSSAVSYLKYPPISRNDLFQPLVPQNIQSLSTISFSSCKREVFRIMPQLRKLGIQETKKDYITGVSSECLANLHFLSRLEILKCSFYKETGKTRDLSRFALPYNLKKLTLSWSYLSWKDMAIFSSLGHLKVLKLKNFAFQGMRWELTNEVFGCLKSLLIENTDLVHWEATSTDHFPCLEHLLLRSCKSLQEIPYDVGELPTLSLLELYNCSKSAEDSAKEFGEHMEYLKVVTCSDC